MMSTIMGVTGPAKLASTWVFWVCDQYDITDVCQESFKNSASAT